MGEVNIFLGGTGKYVAEDIQDSVNFYDLQISEPLAFDLDASTSTSHFGVSLRKLITPEDGITDQIRSLATEWANYQPGSGVGPAPDARKPGPSVVPEYSVLRDIGIGVGKMPPATSGLYALRGHGLSVFSILFDADRAAAGMGAGNKLRQEIESAYRSAADAATEGQLPRFNLVCSTAGGTGAGMVVPTAMWIRQQFPGATINLIGVTPSAFKSVLQGNPQNASLGAKGRSGTYALLRELSFFQDVDPWTSEFATRSLPVSGGAGMSNGLQYRPGGKLFERIYWVGGRSLESPADAFEEAGVLLRILSDDDSAEALRGQTGSFPLGQVASVASIQYPKLQIQRKLVFRGLASAYQSLRQPAAIPAGGVGPTDGIGLFDYVGPETDTPLGSWFAEQKSGAFARASQATALDKTSAQKLDEKLQQAAELESWDQIQTGSRVANDGIYDETDEQLWREYRNKITTESERLSARNQGRLTATVKSARETEEEAFGQWVRSRVFNDLLSGDEGKTDLVSTRDALSLLDSLEEEADLQDQKFQADQVLPVDSPSQSDSAVNDQVARFTKPQEQGSGPSGKIYAAALAVAGIIGAIGFLIAREIDETDPLFDLIPTDTVLAPVIIAIAMLLGARGIMYVLLGDARNDAKLSTRRIRAENSLLDLYRRRDSVRAVNWMIDEIRGDEDRRSFFSNLKQQIREVRSQVETLDTLYGRFFEQASAESQSSRSAPGYVKEQVGTSLLENASDSVIENIGPEILQRIRVESMTAQQSVSGVSQLAIRMVHTTNSDRENLVFEEAYATAAGMLSILDGDPNQETLVQDGLQLNSFSQAVWNIANAQLADTLPNDFSEALHADGRGTDARALLSAKMTALANMLPQPPSVELRGGAGRPTVQRLYVGSLAIQALLQEAHQTGGSSSDGRIMNEYLSNYTVVPALGEQAAFLELWTDPRNAAWAPNVISNANEMQEAFATYYGGDGVANAIDTAAENCFTIIPELLAATKLELGGNPVPLAPAITARLLGSDLDTDGPTYAELFYLLRARGVLATETEGDGPEARQVTFIQDDSVGRLRLCTKPVRGVNDQTTFGEGRGIVADFDAFSDFMRFDGTPLVDGGPIRATTNQEAQVNISDWAEDPDIVRRLQRVAFVSWYTGDIEDDKTRCQQILSEDVELMKRSQFNDQVVGDWGRAFGELVSGRRRSDIRKAHLQ